MNKTINISLPKNLADLAQSQVDSGYYSSVSEVIRDSLRKLLMSRAIPTIQKSNKAIQVAEQAEKEYQAGNYTEFEKIEDLLK